VTKMVEAEGARRRAGEQPRGGGGGHEATCTVRHCCSCVYVKCLRPGTAAVGQERLIAASWERSRAAMLCGA